MSFMEAVKKEFDHLKSYKKAYETVAFLGFMVLIVQQIVYLIINLIDYGKTNWFTTANFVTSNLQNYVARIVGINNASTIIVIIAILAWLLYYVVLYFLVYRFADKRNMSKWTWTLFVAFGPTIFLTPAYIWFVLFAFRKELMGAYKRVAEEYKGHHLEEKNVKKETKTKKEEKKDDDE